LPWRFASKPRSLEVQVDGSLVVNDTALAIQAVSGGPGLMQFARVYFAPMFANGRVVTVLDDWPPAVRRLLSLLPEPPSNTACVESLHRLPSKSTTSQTVMLSHDGESLTRKSPSAFWPDSDLQRCPLRAAGRGIVDNVFSPAPPFRWAAISFFVD
jgi:hypothetical protein